MKKFESLGRSLNAGEMKNIMGGTKTVDTGDDGDTAVCCASASNTICGAVGKCVTSGNNCITCGSTQYCC
jgi:hypothetical protein